MCCGCPPSVHQDGTKERVDLTMHLVWPKTMGIDENAVAQRLHDGNNHNEHVLCLRWALSSFNAIWSWGFSSRRLLSWPVKEKLVGRCGGRFEGVL